MSDFSDFVQAELAERVSTETIAATGSLLVKADNPFSKDYDQLSQGTSGQILISAGTGALPVWSDQIIGINALSVDTIAAADTLAFYDDDGGHNNKITFANFESTLSHNNLVSGTIVSHDTSATGAQLDTLTDNSIANTLHRHSELVASDGSPDPALSVDAVGDVGVGIVAPLGKLHVNGGDMYFGDEANFARTVFFRRNGVTIGGWSTINNLFNMYGGATPASHFSLLATGVLVISDGYGPTIPGDHRMEINTTTGGILRLANSSFTVGAGASLGAIEWYSNDSSTFGRGTRAFIKAIENDGGIGRSYDLHFGTGAGVAATTKMILDKSGNLTVPGKGTFGTNVTVVLGDGDRGIDVSTGGFSGYMADDSEAKGFYLTDGTTTVEFVVTAGAAVFTGMSGFVSIAGSTLLHVSGPSGDAKIQLQRSNIITVGGQNFGEIEFANSIGTVLASLGFDAATSGNTEARFFISMSNNTDALTINEDGYVGIAGDSSPNFASTILHVRDTSNPPVVTVQCATNNADGCKLRLTETTLFQGGYIHYNGSTNVLDIGMHNTNNTSLASDLPMLRFNRDGDDIIVLAGVNFNIVDTAFLVIDKTSTSGIKIDTTSPTFGFADLLGEVFARNTGTSKPTRAAWKDGTFGFQFRVNDNEEFEFHIPHDYVKGTPIFLHIHWGHNVTTVTGGTITFDYEMTYAKGHGQSSFGDNAIGTIVSATVPTTQYSHELSEAQVSTSGGSGTQIDTDDLEPDGVIKMTVGVNANDLTVSSGGAPDIFMHYIDIHYQTTGLIGTKGKAPDFYA